MMVFRMMSSLRMHATRDMVAVKSSKEPGAVTYQTAEFDS